jgi:hypothetical protein
MKQIVFLSMFLLSFSALAAEDCKPIHKSSPISFSVSAKKDKNTIYSSSMVVTGNELSPVQPAEKLNYLAGTLSFSLTPVTACKDGVQVDFDGFENKKQQLIPWGKSVVIDGKSDSEYFVKVTAVKVKS